MILAGTCVVILLLALLARAADKNPPLDRDEIRRMRRFADQIHREQALPYE